jgi:hypothetical protein
VIAIAAEVMAARLMRLKWWMEIGGIFFDVPSNAEITEGRG